MEERERGGRRGRGEDRPIEREGTCTMSRASGRREPSSSRQSGGPQSVGNYTLLEVLGQGTFGEVLLAVERHTHESVAVKVLERDKIADDDARQRLANEISILHRVHHTHLLQLLEVIEEVDRIYLVTEHVGGGELFNYIVEKGRLDEAEAAKLFSQMVAAVDSCHRNLVCISLPCRLWRQAAYMYRSYCELRPSRHILILPGRRDRVAGRPRASAPLKLTHTHPARTWSDSTFAWQCQYVCLYWARFAAGHPPRSEARKSAARRKWGY